MGDGYRKHWSMWIWLNAESSKSVNPTASMSLKRMKVSRVCTKLYFKKQVATCYISNSNVLRYCVPNLARRSRIFSRKTDVCVISYFWPLCMYSCNVRSFVYEAVRLVIPITASDGSGTKHLKKFTKHSFCLAYHGSWFHRLFHSVFAEFGAVRCFEWCDWWFISSAIKIVLKSKKNLWILKS